MEATRHLHAGARGRLRRRQRLRAPRQARAALAPLPALAFGLAQRALQLGGLRGQAPLARARGGDIGLERLQARLRCLLRAAQRLRLRPGRGQTPGKDSSKWRSWQRSSNPPLVLLLTEHSRSGPKETE
jgi:hypothetical protein